MTGELARLLDAFIMSPANHYEVADLPRPLRGEKEGEKNESCLKEEIKVWEI